MNSGLYACAGASATASAAAWAKRFEEPITKESNVYRGLIPPGSGRGSGGGSVAGGGTGWDSRTASRSRRSAPVASLTAARISSTKCPSIHSRVKSFGTDSTKVSSSTLAPPTSLNQLRNVLSLSAPRKRADTSSQRLSAVSSIGCSTGPSDSSVRSGRSADNSSVPAEDSMRISGHGFFAKSAVVQGKHPPPHGSPQVWKEAHPAGAAMPL